MINYLIGYAREITPDTVVIEVNGIGYSVTIAKPQDFRLDQLVKVFTYMQVKEDGICLYGFKTKDELNLFLRLINVSGIGPKTAQKIVEKYGEDTLDIISNHPNWIAEFKGISPRKAVEISDQVKKQTTFYNLFDLALVFSRVMLYNVFDLFIFGGR